MATSNQYDIVSLAKEGLIESIKRQLKQDMVEEAVDAYRKKVTVLIENKLEALVGDRIESLRDVKSLRDEYKVYVEWKEKKGVPDEVTLVKKWNWMMDYCRVNLLAPTDQSAWVRAEKAYYEEYPDG